MRESVNKNIREIEMKRFTKIFLLMVCALSLIVFSIGCADKGDESTSTSNPTSESTFESTSETTSETTSESTSEPHTHVAGSELFSDSQSHWNKCECGEIMNKTPHTFTELRIAEQPTKAAYIAGDKFDKQGMKVEGACVCGDIEVTDYTVAYQTENATGFAAGDTHVVVKYGELSANVTVTVGKLKLEKPAADETEFVYNGSEQTYTIAENDYYTVSGNKQTNAGSYTVTVALKDKDNVSWTGDTTDDATYKFDIAKKKVAVVWTKAESYVYNDAELAAPTAKIVDVNENDVALTVSGDKLDTAGTFTFAATIDDDNYELEGAECIVTVLFYNEVTEFDVVAKINCDETPRINATAPHGEVKYYYSETESGEFVEITSDTVFAAEKTYYVKAVVAAGDNYIGAESEVKTFIKNHSYNENGKCEKGDAYNTAGVTYAYSEEKGVYYVTACANDVTEVIVLPAYSDGEHEEKPVTYIGFEAFAEKANLVKVILPESVTDLGGGAFRSCANLEYVSMTGVKKLLPPDDGSRPDSNKEYNNNFLNCTKLAVVIVGSGFTTDTQQFISTSAVENAILNLYVDGTDNAVLAGNNNMWTGNVFYKGNAEKCLKWNFDDNGNIIQGPSAHDYNDSGICSVCGAYGETLTQGVVYNYDSANECYYVGFNKTLNVAVLNILGTYDDGTNGTHPVKYIRNSAFIDNGYITKVIIHENIEQLDGGVFQNCAKLQYVSMVGITDMAFLNLSGKGIYVNEKEVVTNNNFHLCTSLRYLIVNKNFNLFRDNGDAQQFPGDAKCIDLYVDGTENESNIRVVGGNNGLLSGVIYYKGDPEKCLQWNFVDGEIVHGVTEHNYVDGVCAVCGKKNAMGVDYKFYNGSYYVAGYTGTSEIVNVFGEWDDGENGKANVTFVKNAAFKNNKTLKRVVLHKNITRLEGEVFSGCSNLEYVSMTGVTDIPLENISYNGIYVGQEAYTTNNFMNCGSLTTLIVGEKLVVNGNQFIIHGVDGLQACVNVYLSDENGSGTVTVPAGTSNQLLTNNYYHYSKTESAGCWHYDENGDAALWA